MAKELSESERVLAEKVAKDLVNGKITTETINNFKKLNPAYFEPSPHFGNAPLPDDDW